MDATEATALTIQVGLLVLAIVATSSGYPEKVVQGFLLFSLSTFGFSLGWRMSKRQTEKKEKKGDR